MSCSIVSIAKVLAGSSLTVRHRIIDSNGDNITEAAVTAITCAVYDPDSATPTVATATPTVSVASSVHDVLQSWDEDSIGLNWSYSIAGGDIPTADKRYRIVFTFAMVSGEDFIVVWEIQTENPIA